MIFMAPCGLCSGAHKPSPEFYAWPLGLAMTNAAAQAPTLKQAVQSGLAASPAIRAAQSAFPAIEGGARRSARAFLEQPSGFAAGGCARQLSSERTGREFSLGTRPVADIRNVGRQRLRRASATAARAHAEHNVNEVRAQTAVLTA